MIYGGPGVAAGYVDGFWPNIKSFADENGFYHSGDLVRRNPDGSATFIRRVSQVVKL